MQLIDAGIDLVQFLVDGIHLKLKRTALLVQLLEALDQTIQLKPVHGLAVPQGPLHVLRDVPDWPGCPPRRTCSFLRCVARPH